MTNSNGDDIITTKEHLRLPNNTDVGWIPSSVPEYKQSAKTLSEEDISKSRRPNICHRCSTSFWSFVTSSTIFRLLLCYGYLIWVFFLDGSSNSEIICHLAYPVCLNKLVANRGGTNYPLCQLAVLFEVQTLPIPGRIHKVANHFWVWGTVEEEYSY